MEKIDVDVIRRVYAPNSDGAFLEIAPSPDFPTTCVVIQTTDKPSKDWFGVIGFTLSAPLAVALGKALLDAAKELGVTP